MTLHSIVYDVKKSDQYHNFDMPGHDKVTSSSREVVGQGAPANIIKSINLLSLHK